MRRVSWKESVEVLGILGVIGSLVFVALEVRQNTNAVRSATIQAIADMSYDGTMMQVEHADLRAARAAAKDGTLTDDQRSQLDSWYTGLMRIQQNRYVQAELGVLDLEDAMQIGGRAAAYRDEYFADFWRRKKDAFPQAFREYIERDILVLTAGSR
jgi:hypothetical protein